MRKFKVIILIILSIILTNCATTKSSSKLFENKLLNINISNDIYRYNALGKKNIIFNNTTIKKRLEIGDKIERGEKVGIITPIPEVLSEKNDRVLKKAIYYYENNNFQAAYESMHPIFTDEKDNKFYLFWYGKILFWKPEFHNECINVYERLLKLIEIEQGNTSVLIIDYWFFEAYWKLGCKYLDSGNYSKATFEITKFLMTIDSLEYNDLKLYDQVLSYLTECYFYLNNKEINNYFYQEALKINSNNQYIKKYKL